MSKNREEILLDVWNSTYKYFQHAALYERLVPNFYNVDMCETETYTIIKIGNEPGTTATEISDFLKITLAATSKMIRKMRDRGWVEQIRNENNNRIYNLYLTDAGQKIYNEVEGYNDHFRKLQAQSLTNFTNEELATYAKVMNSIYENQVEALKSAYEK